MNAEHQCLLDVVPPLVFSLCLFFFCFFLNVCVYLCVIECLRISVAEACLTQKMTSFF